MFQMISLFMLEIIHGYEISSIGICPVVSPDRTIQHKTCSTPLVLLLSTVHFSPSPRCHSPRHSWIPPYASEGLSSFTPSLLAKTATTHSLRGERRLGGEVGKRRLGGEVCSALGRNVPSM